LSKYVSKDKIYPYYFSSLTKKEIEDNSKHLNKNNNKKVLVVGQFLYVKGLDIALECAKLDKNIEYRFIGSGNRSITLEEKVKEMNLKNVEIIPFLSKEELYKEYQSCLCLLLPSRQECWGLVVNEAASFGCPIVSTYGSGAAVEFLKNDYSEYLAKPNDSKDLYDKLKILIEDKKNSKYKNYLINSSKNYTIENSVSETIKLFKK